MGYTRAIYVASLADYNAGRLHGEWIDADQDPDDIQAAVNAMLARSPELHICQWCGKGENEEHKGHAFLPGNPEEWAIHDYEGFDGIKLGEWATFARVSKLAELLEEHGEAFAAWYSYETRDEIDLDELGEKFTDAYMGSYENVKAFAYEYLDESVFKDVPTVLEQHFDWDGYAHELEICGDFTMIEEGHSKVHIFNAHV